MSTRFRPGCDWNSCGTIAGTMKVSFQAARSIGFKGRVNGLFFLFARRHDFERTIRPRTLKL
jgi:hypothetical protein